MGLKKLIVFAGVAAGFMPVSTQAQGGYAGEILRMGLASRSEAMGRAYTAVVGSPESAFYNPAAATEMSARTIDLSLRALPLDRSFAYIGFATAVQPAGAAGAAQGRLNGGLAISWIHASVDNIDGRDFDGEKYATFTNSQNSVRLAFALQPNPAVSVGIGGHITWNRFPRLGQNDETISANAAGLDLGLLVHGIKHFWFGVVAKNINAKYSWNTDKVYERGSNKIDKFPQIVRFGVSTDILDEKLLLAFDFEDSDLQKGKVFLGGAYQLAPQIAVRGGLRDANPALGADYNFRFSGLQGGLHYAFVSQPDQLSSEHVFSWSFTF